MTFAFWILAMALAVVTAIPALVYVVECLAGSVRGRPLPLTARRPRQPVAILVPAHDEESGIASTIASIRAEMRSGDRLLVVADNCSDATASRARAAGAEVVERSDPERRGKGYAIDFGLTHLASAPRPVVVFVDADCTLFPGTLDALALEVEDSGRPVQSCNLMTTSERTGASLGIPEFAFRIKNLVRPRGLHRLGLPCLLTGTGMALPWTLVGHVRMAHRHLVEDMKLGLDLAAEGFAPLYCERAGVRSRFPETASGALTQRSRWENGHLAMLASCLPALWKRQTWRSRDSLVMTLDVLVPPLTLLVLCQIVALLVGLSVWVAGLGVGPLALASTSALLLAGATLLAWAVHARDILPARRLLSIPAFMLAKVRIYPRALLGRGDQSWIRTDRSRGA